MKSFIKGNVRRILFSSNNGYVVGIFKVKETNDSDLEDYLNKTITFTGTFSNINNELSYTFYGEYINHARYGYQFCVNEYEVNSPTDEEGIILYLSSGIFKGIGVKTATDIVKKFGLNTLKIIEDSPNDLLMIKGMTTLKINYIHNKMIEMNMDQKLVITLTNLGFSVKESLNIINKYKEKVNYIIENNIYELLEFSNFNKLDTIFLKNNLENESVRIKALIPYLIKTLSYKRGDTIIDKESLYLNFNTYFKEKIELETFLYNLDILNKEGILILIDDFITLREYYESELYISDKLKLINKTLNFYNKKEIDESIEKYQEFQNITFNTEQKKAIKNALINNLYVITGGPGTGKTTIIKAIVDIYRTLNIEQRSLSFSIDQKKEEEIVLLAPTGRSAKRLKESTNTASYTIHKYLRWNKETSEFGLNQENKSNAKLLIIDEVSMIDIFLFSSLLKALKDNVKLILVGDAFQLPSIAPGNVLSDLLDSEVINKLALKQIYRTKKGSYINELASNIKDFNLFENNKKYEDFLFIESLDINTKGYLKQICEKRMLNIKNLDNFQVLAPMYKTENGIDNLNALMQNIFNPSSKSKKEITIAGVTYREKDKVMELVNDIDNNIYNGDIGYIESINGSGRNIEIFINFSGNIVKFGYEKLEEFTLAYAVSIHKSQGSEYDDVVIILSRSFKRMFYNKLIYTAVTRAKKSLIIIGEKESFNQAILSNYSSERLSLLLSFLNE